MAKKKNSKFAFNFEEMEDLSARLEKAGGSIQQAADRALKASHAHITKNLSAAIRRHHKTGDTEKTLDKGGGVVWGNEFKARVNIGFNLQAGGVPSVFLMWGTPKHGKHPGIKADAKLKNAAFGAKTKREVAAIQRQEMEKAVQEIAGGDV